MKVSGVRVLRQERMLSKAQMNYAVGNGLRFARFTPHCDFPRLVSEDVGNFGFPVCCWGLLAEEFMEDE